MPDERVKDLEASSARPRRGRLIPWWMVTLLFVTILGVTSFVVDSYLSYVATSWVIVGLVGLSLDLVWGRAGVLSLGQTAFYGIGSYVGSVVAINLAGVTANTLIWSLPIGALAGASVACVVGSAVFYGRLGALQTTILTYTFTLLLWTGARSFTCTMGAAVVGGDNGLANIPGYVVGLRIGAVTLGPQGMFVCVLALAAGVFLLVQGLMRTPFGSILDCVRLNAGKTELLGYDVRRYQLAIFSLSGGIAGLAGVLYGGWSNYLSPSIFSPQEALLVPIYVLVGGRGTLAGSFLGAFAVGGLSFWLGGGVIGRQTTLVMGLALIVLVLFLPGGLIGTVRQSSVARIGRRNVSDSESDENERPLQVDFPLFAALQAAVGARGQRLEARRVLKRFGGVTPVNRVTQYFDRGAVRCLIGPNGAGKSSLLRCCTGTYQIDCGAIVLAGQDISRWQISRRVEAGLGMKTQVPQVFDELDVLKNLWVAAYSRVRDTAVAAAIADQMLQAFGLARQGARAASQLSHGHQQWLDIGMVLCLAPSTVLLDEPAAGMTAGEKQQLARLIRKLAETTSVVVVEHDMDFVRTLDAEVTVLHLGEVFAQGKIEDLRKDERILEIYLGRREHVRGF